MAGDVDWDAALQAFAREAAEEVESDEPVAWVTLEEAEAASGASRSTLRSWYRVEAIPSTTVEGPHGPQRLVDLDAVMARAQLSPRLRRKQEERGADVPLPPRRPAPVWGAAVRGDVGQATALEQLVAQLVAETEARARAEALAEALLDEVARLRADVDALRRRLDDLS